MRRGTADDERDQHALAASVAAGAALDAAVDNAKDCIQVLGGIGFTWEHDWEHDAHLYLRRALSLRQWLGWIGPLAAACGRVGAVGDQAHARAGRR
jgi:alkylation response protein AidB-like acyl-CoA dehydrogenase